MSASLCRDMCFLFKFLKAKQDLETELKFLCSQRVVDLAELTAQKWQ